MYLPLSLALSLLIGSMAKFRRRRRRRGRKRKGAYRSRKFKAAVQREIIKTAETKWYNVIATHQTFTDDATGSPHQLVLDNISQGTSEVQRIGESVYVRQWTCQFVFYCNNSTMNIQRLVLYMPKHDSADNLGSDNIEIHDNIDYNKYVVFKDFLFRTTANWPRVFNLTQRFKGRGLKYVFTTSAAFTAENPLKLYIVGDQNATNAPSVSYKSRVTYKDP